MKGTAGAAILPDTGPGIPGINPALTIFGPHVQAHRRPAQRLVIHPV